MDHDTAVRLVESRVGQENLVKHMRATEAVMRALAERLGEDVEQWGLVGLLHDLDVVETADDPARHGRLTAEWLRAEGVADEELLHAVAAHNPANGTEIESRLDRALFAADPLTGLITAAALIRPEKQLAPVKLKSLKKRFREPSFARGARREDIETIEELGVPLEDFLALGLAAMQGISEDLGL